MLGEADKSSKFPIATFVIVSYATQSRESRYACPESHSVQLRSAEEYLGSHFEPCKVDDTGAVPSVSRTPALTKPGGPAPLEYVQMGECSRSIQVTHCCCWCAICCRMSS